MGDDHIMGLAHSKPERGDDDHNIEMDHDDGSDSDDLFEPHPATKKGGDESDSEILYNHPTTPKTPYSKDKTTNTFDAAHDGNNDENIDNLYEDDGSESIYDNKLLPAADTPLSTNKVSMGKNVDELDASNDQK